MGKIEIATPVSHLFQNNEEVSQKVASLSDCLECRDRTAKINFGFQKLFHSDLQPIHEWDNLELDYFRSIARSKNDLEYVTFHVASNCTNPETRDRMFYVGPQSKVYSRQEMKDNARNNFRKLREIFGPKIIFAIENNNYYPTDAYVHVTEASFLKELMQENDLYMLFDISHAKVTARNMKISLESYLKDFPFDQVLQIHVSHCGGPYENGLYYDDHAEIVDEDWVELPGYLKRCPAVKFVTVEYYKDANKLYGMLEKLRGVLG